MSAMELVKDHQTKAPAAKEVRALVGLLVLVIDRHLWGKTGNWLPVLVSFWHLHISDSYIGSSVAAG
jgi:hypothetical protein